MSIIKREEALEEAQPLLPSFDLQQFRQPSSKSARAVQRRASPPARIVGDFLKGPIPLDWLTRSAQLGGKVLHVALAIWFERGRRNKDEICLTTGLLKRFNVERKAKYEALRRLTDAGLITFVKATIGKNPWLRVVGTLNPTPVELPDFTQPQRRARPRRR